MNRNSCQPYGFNSKLQLVYVNTSIYCHFFGLTSVTPAALLPIMLAAALAAIGIERPGDLLVGQDAALHLAALGPGTNLDLLAVLAVSAVVVVDNLDGRYDHKDV